MSEKMEQKKYLILLLFLLLVMVVGYAILSSSGNISGVTKIKEAGWDIHFENVNINPNSVSLVEENHDMAASIDPSDNTKVRFSVTLDKPGDFYEFLVDAVNDGSIDGMVDTVVSNLNHQPIDTLPSYLNYTVTHENGGPILPNHLLAHNTREKYKVRIEYSRDIDNSEVVGEEVDLDFDFTIHYVQADDSAVGFIDYQVVHKYENLDHTYSSVIENLKGVGGSVVRPSVSPKVGFISPSVQSATVLEDGSLVVEYIYERRKYHLTLNDSEYIETSTPSGEYYYETPITLKALEKEDYFFDHWSNDKTEEEITFELKEDTTIGPVYAKSKYLVNFDANGGVCNESSVIVNYGNTLTLPDASKEGYYLDGWYTDLTSGIKVSSPYTPVDDVTLYAKWKVSVESLNITNTSLSVRMAETVSIEMSNASSIEEEYTFVSSDSETATVDVDGVISGVNVGTTTVKVIGSISHKEKVVTVEVLPLINSYLITLNPNGGVLSTRSIVVDIGQNIGELPTPERENRIFDGWYTSLTDGVMIDSSYVPSQDTEIFARWKKIVCVHANDLHTSLCEHDSEACYSLGYSATGSKGSSTLAFGKVSVGDYNYGNVFNCDVNDDDVYDNEKERFFYIGSNGNTLSFIYHSNFEGEEGISTLNNFDYDTALRQFPTTRQWSGVYTTYGDNAGRFATVDEIKNVCGIPENKTGGTIGDLDNCIFLFENTRFLSPDNGRSGIWLQHYDEEGDEYHRIHARERIIAKVSSNSKNVVKPVIDVPSELVNNTVDPSMIVTVHFDMQGAGTIPDVLSYKNAQFGLLPEPVYDNHIFEGWYTDTSFTTRVFEDTIVSGNTTFYAKWRKLEGVCVVNGEDFGKMSLCLKAVSDNEKTTIQLIDDVVESFSIGNRKNIVFDLNNHSIVLNSNSITNNGLIEIKNGSIIANGDATPMNNNSSGKLTLNHVTLTANSTRQALYNNGGEVVITSGSILQNNSDSRSTVHNLNDGTIEVIDATIVNSLGAGIYNELGTLVIGQDDDYINHQTPVILGNSYGVIGSEYSFFDGIIKGVVGAVDSEYVIVKDDDSVFHYSEEVIDSQTYQVLSLSSKDCQVAFHANGGGIESNYKIIERGTALGTLPVPTRSGYYFTGWYTSLTNGILVDENYIPSGDIELYAIWKVSVQSLVVENPSLIIEAGNSVDIILSNKETIEEEYTFTSTDNNVAVVDQDGKVEGISEGNCSIIITGLSSNETVVISVRVSGSTITYYVVNLNANGGFVSPNSVSVDIGEEIGAIPTPTRDNYVFEGWYTSLQDGVEVDSSYIPTGDVTIFAHWKKVVCVSAVSFHKETCDRTNAGCYAAGYHQGELISYGQASLGGADQIGDIYNCDVNDDDIYDDLTERFYYLTNQDDHKVFIFHSNFEGEDGIATVNIFEYNTALTKLPTHEQWPLVPITFDSSAARFPYLSEIIDNCVIPNSSNFDIDTNRCTFLFENSRFISDTNGRSAYWITYPNESGQYRRVHTSFNQVATVNSSSKNGARPVIEVPSKYVSNTIDSSNVATIHFDSLGGSSVQDISVPIHSTISRFENPEKEDYKFAGWYTNTSYTTQVTLDTEILGDMTLYAKWDELDGVCVVNGEDYETLSQCLNKCPNNTKTTIRLIKDIESNLSISSSKDVVLNLNGHTLYYDNGTVITNSGILEIRGGEITTLAESGAVNNNSTGNLKLVDTRVIANGTRQALYNNGGIVEISGNSYLSSLSEVRATVHNLKSGTITILGGEIVSLNQQAVYNESGTLIIGEDDGVVHTSTPILRGGTYGVTGNSYSFYDGVIKGVDGAVMDESIITKDSNSNFERGEEVIDSNTYHTLLLRSIHTYTVDFNANGGSVDPTSITVNQGDYINQLPIPIKDGSTFLGWYTSLTDGVEVSNGVIPTGDLTYYARWS